MNASTHDPTFTALDTSLDVGSHYLGGIRGRAIETLAHAIRNQEILVLLTGPAAVGKTVVLNAALAKLADEPIRAIRLDNPGNRTWSQRDLVRHILGGSTADPASSPAPPDHDVAETLADLMAATEGEERVVIAVDDAQTLTDEAMELLLLLASPARGNSSPPQLILSGRDEFWDRDWRSELRLITGFAERVTLEPLAGQGARDYIEFRLKQAGSNPAISSDALTAILHYSGGLPARIDHILGPADSIRACRGGGALDGDMVEAAIATLALPPAMPVSGLESLMTQPGHAPSEDRDPPPRPIDLASPAPTEPRPALVPDSSILVGPLFRPPSPQIPLVSGGELVPLQAATPVSATTALMVQSIAPRQWRLGRTGSAAATSVMIFASIACVLAIPGSRLSNLIPWPRSTASSDVHRLAEPSRAVPKVTETALLATVRKPKPDETSIQPRPTPATSEPRVAAVTEAVSPVATSGAAPEPSPDPSISDVAATQAPVAVAGGLPSHETDAAVSVTASAATLAPSGLSGAPTAEVIPVPTSRQIAGSTPVALALSPEMATFLQRRGDIMLRQGDVVSARLYFEQAAEAGSQQGAVGAAKTYDPVFLATIATPGLKSDVARAIKWYQVASDTFGDQYADERLKALTARNAQ